MDTDKVIQDLNRRFAAPLPECEPFQIDTAFVVDEFDFFS